MDLSTDAVAPPWRVLVWPGGTEIGLEVRRSLRDHKEVELVGAGSAADGRGPFAYREWVALPDVSDPGWLDALQRVVAERRIDVVYPAHDAVITHLVRLRDEVPAVVVAPPTSTCELVRSKRATYDAVRDVVRVPEELDPAAVRDFPVFAKPDRGQGSQGAVVVSSRVELDLAVSRGSDLVMSMLPGAEFTVDCFSTARDGLLFARARTRSAIRNGIAGRSRDATDQEPFLAMARAISSRLDLRGPWFFQVREDDGGELVLLEVGPRIAGTMALHRVMGVNFALLAVYEACSLPVQVRPQDLDVEIDRPLANRYRLRLDYGTVYCDLDDTLVVRGEVNPRLVSFLYGAVTRGKRLVLLTRHRADVGTTLRRFRLQSLFDEVIRVADHEDKASHITDPKGILIDDSFRERRDAAERLGIMTFDASSIEVLVEDLA
jgi:hypothetical protein